MVINIPLLLDVGTITTMPVIALLALTQLVGLIQAEVVHVIITAYMC
jgi:hypothetical protein